MSRLHVVSVVAAVAFLGIATACSSNNASSPGSEAGAGSGGGAGTSGAGGASGSGGTSGAGGVTGAGGAANTCEWNGCTFDLQPYYFTHKGSTTLACFCSAFSKNGSDACPKTEADARAKLAQNPYRCPDGGVGQDIVRTGCGYVTVGHESLGSNHWYYDASTGALVGADISDDTEFGACHAAMYIGGVVPPDCPTATTCTLCPTSGSNPPPCN